MLTAKGFVTLYFNANLILCVVFFKPYAEFQYRKCGGKKPGDHWEPNLWAIPCLMALSQSTSIPGTMKGPSSQLSHGKILWHPPQDRILSWCLGETHPCLIQGRQTCVWSMGIKTCLQPEMLPIPSHLTLWAYKTKRFLPALAFGSASAKPKSNQLGSWVCNCSKVI